MRNGELITAQSSLFTIDGGRTSWSFTGRTGSYSSENNFSVTLLIPYNGEELFERTYKLGDGQGLESFHQYWLPPFPGFDVIGSDQANNVELTVRLDPRKGTAEGNFIADFKKRRVSITGKFNLTLQQ